MSEQNLAAVNDIFQDSDDDSVPGHAAARAPAASNDGDMEDIFGESTASRGGAQTKAGTLSGLFDSDDDEDNEGNADGRGHSGSDSKKQSKVTNKRSNIDDLFDSDDDGSREKDSPVKRKRLGFKKKRRLEDSDDEDNDTADGERATKKHKHSSSSSSSKKDKKMRSRRERTAGSSVSKRSGSSLHEGPSTGDTGNDGGDAYDSDGEPARTKADDDFLSEESDEENAGVVREYAEDNEDFDEDRPKHRSKKSSSHGGGDSSGKASSSQGKTTGGNDPFSQALASLKAKKVEVWTDTEKQTYVDRLNVKMREACQQDDEILAMNRKHPTAPQPALNKLNMLTAVQHALSMSMLWNTMLDREILVTLGYWIRPREDGSLPTLSIRTAIYEALLKMPCMPDHLKKTNLINNVVIKPIGQIVFDLMKSKNETVDNKKLLRTIIDKWSREIFSKGTEVAQSLSAYRNDTEIHARLAAKYDAASQSRLKEDEEAKYRKDNHQRARAPMILGHMFTVQPDIDKKALQRKMKKKMSGGADDDDDEAIEVKDRVANVSGSGGGSSSGSSGSGSQGNGNNVGRGGLLLGSGKDGEGGRAALLKRMDGGGARSQGGGSGSNTKRAVSVSVARPSYDFH